MDTSPQEPINKIPFSNIGKRFDYNKAVVDAFVVMVIFLFGALAGYFFTYSQFIDKFGGYDMDSHANHEDPIMSSDEFVERFNAKFGDSNRVIEIGPINELNEFIAFVKEKNDTEIIVSFQTPLDYFSGTKQETVEKVLRVTDATPVRRETMDADGFVVLNPISVGDVQVGDAVYVYAAGNILKEEVVSAEKIKVLYVPPLVQNGVEEDMNITTAE